MDEQAFTYEHFKHASYMLIVCAMMYVALIILPYAVQSPLLLIIYMNICLGFFIHSMFRFVSFIKRHKSLTQKQQRKIIKRHRTYTLKHVFYAASLSALITCITVKSLDLNILQYTGIFGLIFMLAVFSLIRMTMSHLKQAPA